jgi:hypothetical protein
MNGRYIANLSVKAIEGIVPYGMIALYKCVGIYNGRITFYCLCFSNYKFPGNKSSNGKSCEESKNGVVLSE